MRIVCFALAALTAASSSIAQIDPTDGCISERRGVTGLFQPFQSKVSAIEPHIAQYFEGEEDRIFGGSLSPEARRQAFNKLSENDLYGMWRVRRILDKIVYSSRDFPLTTTPTLHELVRGLIGSHAALANSGDLRIEVADLLARGGIRREASLDTSAFTLRNSLLTYSNCLARDLLALQLRQK